MNAWSVVYTEGFCINVAINFAVLQLTKTKLDEYLYMCQQFHL